MIDITVFEVAKAVNGTIIGCNNNIIKDVVTDSRKIKSDDLFVAIKGDNFDGHGFISSSFENGAICALSNTGDIIVPNDKTLIVVKDTKKALGDLAKYFIDKHRIPVVGITGSVGKTTTKDMVASVLSQKYNVLKTIGNFNNDIGLPLTVFSMTKDNNMAVLEMGMNSFGEISYLSNIATPDVALITNVGVSHIENLGSREGILKAKLEIFDNISPNGIGVLNGDDDMLITATNNINTPITWFGIDNKFGFFAENIIEKGLEGISCDISTPKGIFNVNINIPGKHMVLNALSATIVGVHFGIDLEDIKKGIELFVPTKMRMAISKTKSGTTIINDAYNANPVSMKAGIDVLAYSEGTKMAILGDMFELGEFADALHSEVGEYAGIKNIDTLVCIGKHSIKIHESALAKNIKKSYYFEGVEEFISQLKEIIKNHDTILVKASRGMYFEKIVDKIQEVE